VIGLEYGWRTHVLKEAMNVIEYFDPRDFVSCYGSPQIESGVKSPLRPLFSRILWPCPITHSMSKVARVREIIKLVFGERR
jgi:hypothetical protein